MMRYQAVPTQIERKQQLNPEVFTEQFLQAGRPVIVTDAMQDWPGLGKWGAGYLKEELGRHEVQVYNDLFDLVSVTTLGRFLHKNFGRPEHEPAQEYARWYTRFRPEEFFWADKAFEKLAGDWGTPYFLPESNYAVPAVQPPAALRVEQALLPYKGLFISGRGARTRLHRDPWSSSAILCQFHGTKKVVMYSPDQSAYLMDGADCVDLAKPDRQRFPRMDLAAPTCEAELAPGETLFIPGGWLHEVATLSDSISVTWNFVHRTRLRHLCDWLAVESLSAADAAVLRYFLPPDLQRHTEVAALRQALLETI